MNTLDHLQPSFFGTDEAFEKLKNSERSSILVVSDSHGNSSALCDVIRNRGKSCDGFCFCGDGLSDVAECFSMASTDPDLKTAIPPCVVAVCGNCDYRTEFFFTNLSINSDQKRAEFSDFATFFASGFKILITHGLCHEPYSCINRLHPLGEAHNAEIVLFGHTHIPEFTQKDGITFINPGSLTSPRGKTFQPQVAILNLEKGKIPRWEPISHPHH